METTLNNVNSVNYLGVAFHRKLNFNMHIDNIIVKASRTLRFVKRNNLHICDVKALKSSYYV